MANPLIQQGTLNRLACSVTVPLFPNLNVTSSYMGRSFARVEFEGDMNMLIGTGTGAVSSPEPYVFARITVNLLRSQALSSQWLTQAQLLSNIGLVTITPDSSAFQTIPLNDAVIQSIDPGAYDGTDPIVRLTIRGIYYVNASLWALS